MERVKNNNKLTNATNDKMQGYRALCILYQVSNSDVQLHWNK